MELFLPSFFIIALAAALVFFIVPKVSPQIVFFLTLAVLVAMIYIHYDTFKSQYNINTWFTSINNIGYPLLIFVGSIGIIAAVLGFTNGISIPFLSLSKPQTFMTSRKNYKNISPSEVLDLQRQV
jgi:hypothetical protein